MNRSASRTRTGYTVNVLDTQTATEMKTCTYTYRRQWSSREDRNRLGKMARSRQDSFRVSEAALDVLYWSVPGS